MSKNIKIILIVFFILLIGLGGLAGAWYYKNKVIKNNSVLTKPVEQIKKELTASELAMQKIEDKYQAFSKAVTSDGIKSCDKLGSLDKDNCIFALAGAVKEFEFCAAITDESLKTKCQEFEKYTLALKSKDSAQCLNIKDAEYKNNCLSELALILDNLSLCNELLNENKTSCLDKIYSYRAGTEKNITLCAKIVDKNLQADCQMILNNLPLDSDKDGLLDSEEISYGTDAFKADTDGDGLNDYEELSKYHTKPKTPDTDGDGYNDGDEIKKGFDPNVPGKLTPNK